MILLSKDFRRKINKMEKKYDAQFQVIFKVLRDLLDPSGKPKGKLGF